MTSLGKRLKREREKRGWSQTYVANKLGMKRSSTYANWEYDIREPDNDTLSKLAGLYEVTTDYLIGRTNNPNKTLSDGSNLLLDIIELSDDEAIEKLMESFVFKGKPLTAESAKEILSFARYKAAQQE